MRCTGGKTRKEGEGRGEEDRRKKHRVEGR